jgi:hypothetical protein
MKNIVSVVVICFTALSCQPKEVDTLDIRKMWKALTVKENGVLVYNAANAKNTRPSYSGFRLDLKSQEQVNFTDLDNRKLVGKWSLSTDYKRLILQNLVPPPSESSGNIEFYIISSTSNRLLLKRTTDSKKTGNTINEYELVTE